MFFNEENPGESIPDPYFGGQGPERSGCTHCGACLVGCRENAQNTLMKNCLYFAEWGTEIKFEATVEDIRPLLEAHSNGARYEVVYRNSTS